jgi:hypothetical protein
MMPNSIHPRKSMRSEFCVLAAVAVALATSSHAQRRAPAQPAGVPIEIHLQMGTAKYDASGTGECRAAERASIYGVAASQFAVTHNAGAQSLNATLWQPKTGGAMLTMTVSNAGKRYEVDTVKAGPKKDTKGSAHATLSKSGSSATLTISAVAVGGEKIGGTIKCGSVSAIQAEGG